MTDSEITIGETYRLVERLDRRVVELTTEMRGFGALGVRVSALEDDILSVRKDIKDIDEKVGDVVKHAAFVSGGVSLGAFLLSWWPFGKH